MSELTNPTPDEVLVALYRVLKRSKDRMRETGKWPPGEAMRVLPRVDFGNLDDVPSDRLALYTDMVPELERRGWIARTDGFDPPPGDSEIVLTQEGQEHARQLLERGMI